MKNRHAIILPVISAAALASFTVPALPADINLPQTISITAYSLGSGSYNETVAIGAALKKKYGKDFRVIPANNDIARMTPLRSGQVHVSSMGSGVFFAQEGMYEFGDEKWGPQGFYVIAVNLPNQSAGPYVSAKSGINSLADLKGKRVPRVRNAPSLANLMRAYLQFGGLDWKDVQVVEVPGFFPMLKAFMQGQVDVALAATLSTIPKRAHSSPAGPIKWLDLTHADDAAWKRFKAIVPYNQKYTATNGVALGKGVKVEGARYPLPVIIGYSQKVNDEMAYNLAKVIYELYPNYKDATPSTHGYKPTKAHFDSIHPYHPGAVKFYKEVGVWGVEEDKRQAENMKRQQVLKATWDAHKKTSKATGKEFRSAWTKARIAALKGAGLDSYAE